MTLIFINGIDFFPFHFDAFFLSLSMPFDVHNHFPSMKIRKVNWKVKGLEALKLNFCVTSTFTLFSSLSLVFFLQAHKTLSYQCEMVFFFSLEGMWYWMDFPFLCWSIHRRNFLIELIVKWTWFHYTLIFMGSQRVSQSDEIRPRERERECGSEGRREMWPNFDHVNFLL